MDDKPDSSDLTSLYAILHSLTREEVIEDFIPIYKRALTRLLSDARIAVNEIHAEILKLSHEADLLSNNRVFLQKLINQGQLEPSIGSKKLSQESIKSFNALLENTQIVRFSGDGSVIGNDKKSRITYEARLNENTFPVGFKAVLVKGIAINAILSFYDSFMTILIKKDYKVIPYEPINGLKTNRINCLSVQGYSIKFEGFISRDALKDMRNRCRRGDNGEDYIKIGKKYENNRCFIVAEDGKMKFILKDYETVLGNTQETFKYITDFRALSLKAYDYKVFVYKLNGEFILSFERCDVKFTCRSSMFEHIQRNVLIPSTSEAWD